MAGLDDQLWAARTEKRPVACISGAVRNKTLVGQRHDVAASNAVSSSLSVLFSVSGCASALASRGHPQPDDLNFRVQPNFVLLSPQNNHDHQN